jgi:hypothetical protein
MARKSIHSRLERLRERVRPPEEPGNGEARDRAREALGTIHRLILEHGDEISRDYKERIERGENHKDALVAAKREALSKTEEGRRAWAWADAIEERRRGEGA